MIRFEHISAVEANENYQGFTWREFSFSADKEPDDSSLIMAFVDSDYFIKQTLKAAEYGRQQGYLLRQAFNAEQVRINDFKRLTKSAVATFLIEFSSTPDWGEDHDEFIALLDKYLALQARLADNAYYLLNKEWLDKDNKRILDPESWVYLYYFVIIHINRSLSTLIFTEWSYD